MTKAKTALITGVTGQDGAYLARLLLDDPGRDQPADSIRVSSHAVLGEQAERMDVPDQRPSLQKAFAPQGSSTY